MPQLPLIIGHRGSSALLPENTIAAFRKSIAEGADGIEFDVRLAADNLPVVIHDATLTRTSSINSHVSELTSEALTRTDAGEWFYLKSGITRLQTKEERIPTLEQVFDLFTDQTGQLYLEMKGEPVGVELPKQVARLIAGHDFYERVIVESFDHAAIDEIRKLDSGIRTAALFDRKLAKPLSLLRRRDIVTAAQEVSATEIALHHSLVREELVAAARDAGFEVVVWTVDDISWISRARKLGIKALISNNPAVMLKAREESGPD